jgi:hypothetical protein
MSRLLAVLILAVAIVVMIGCATAVYRGASLWFALGIVVAPAAGAFGAIAVYERLPRRL